MRKGVLILTALLTVFSAFEATRLYPAEIAAEILPPITEAESEAYVGVGNAQMVENEPVAYGARIEVVDAAPDAPKASEPVFNYTGSRIDFQYYNSGGGTFKLRVACGGQSSTMSIYPDNAIHKIPLLYGNGTYTFSLFEQLSNGQARTIVTKNLQCGEASPTAQPAQASPAPDQVGVESQATAYGASTSSSSSSWNIDTSNPYLTPVADINWGDGLNSVKKARELCSGKTSDRAKAKAVYDYLVARLTYDYDLVGKLPSGYTPSMDNTFSSQKGICYDFASLYAGMMRSVGVECKLVMGYNTMVDGYHAWNEVKVDGVWKRLDVTIDCQLRSFGSNYGFDSPQGSVTVKKSY